MGFLQALSIVLSIMHALLRKKTKTRKPLHDDCVFSVTLSGLQKLSAKRPRRTAVPRKWGSRKTCTGRCNRYYRLPRRSGTNARFGFEKLPLAVISMPKEGHSTNIFPRGNTFLCNACPDKAFTFGDAVQ